MKAYLIQNGHWIHLKVNYFNQPLYKLIVVSQQLDKSLNLKQDDWLLSNSTFSHRMSQLCLWYQLILWWMMLFWIKQMITFLNDTNIICCFCKYSNWKWQLEVWFYGELFAAKITVQNCTPRRTIVLKATILIIVSSTIRRRVVDDSIQKTEDCGFGLFHSVHSYITPNTNITNGRFPTTLNIYESYENQKLRSMCSAEWC